MGRGAAGGGLGSAPSRALAIATAAGLGVTTAAALWAAARYASYRRNIRRAKGLPQVHQFLSYFSLLQALVPGARRRYTRDFYRQAVALFEELDTPLFAFVSSGYLGVHINEAHLFREVCVTKRRTFPKATHLYDVLRIFGDNVVTTEGEVWKRHRAVASRAFSDANNRLVFATTLRCVHEMVAAWERQAGEAAALEAAAVLAGAGVVNVEEDEGILDVSEGAGGAAGGGAATPMSAVASFPQHLDVQILEDVVQMTLAIITTAAFGFPIHAAYGTERRARNDGPSGRERGPSYAPITPTTAGAGADAMEPPLSQQGKGKRYELSFTRCMEIVSARTLAKVLLPGWALRLPVFGLKEVGVAFREFNDHLLDVVERERALQRAEKQQQHKQHRRRLPSAVHWRDVSSGGGSGPALGGGGSMDASASSEGLSVSVSTSSAGGGAGKEKGASLFRLLVQANEEEEEGGQGQQSQHEGGAVVARGKRLEIAELLGNAFIFLLAGHETSSHALTFALMLLAAHPDEQRALQAEVDAVLEQGKRELAYEDLDRLVLCHGAMNEALRLFPPVVIVPKVCVQDGVELVAGEGRRFPVPKGAVVSLNIYALHRNPKHYPDPDAFKPRRWDPSAEGYTPAEYFAFAPFSLGERSCIGRKFGQITILASLATLLHHFDVSVPPGTDLVKYLDPVQVLTLSPAHGTRLLFTHRRRQR